MKKWLAAIFVLVILPVAAIYLFIPATIPIRHSVIIPVTEPGLKRALLATDSWDKWWPETQSGKDTAAKYTYHRSVYDISHIQFNALAISIETKDLVTNSQVTLIPVKTDTAEIVWQAEIAASNNPFRRWQAWRRASRLKKDIHTLLETMQSFFSVSANIYGFDIRKERVADSTLISTYAISPGYPSTEFIYQLIDQLKAYTASQSAKETGFPMLNIHTTDSISYLTRVAIPVDKKMPSSGNISYKWMLGGGNILMTEIHGGPQLITQAMQQVEYYVADYQRVAPAIPFLSLVTDRRATPDTSKWITRIYYPVM